MGAIYTEEQRERLQRHIVDLVRKNGRMKMPQLASATYASHDSIRRYLKMLVSQGEVYVVSGKGVFLSERVYREWLASSAKKSRVIRKPAQKQGKAGVQPYDRHQNVICRECRNSESMQRVLAFYRGGFQELVS
ncbi:TPA: DUF977 family protein [Escherichia coli]|uniref:DUF977 family protein n=1 Tax=Escherichia TaxID=561 RepID=UPI0002074E51|nr:MULTISPECIES: DUF977 family protein [Escherichia]EEX5264593.1 DUF977 family protein [Escherichia coli O157]EHQ5524838.1 DUF977 family protein [Escherichia coli O2]EJE7367892.1 DUF977 family protein [Shigella dysenteriae]EER1409628.1 DUF977 family protein [Escherichia coli]EEX6974463.1 DUF977 family protein [Escherichia coli O157]